MNDYTILIDITSSPLCCFKNKRTSTKHGAQCHKILKFPITKCKYKLTLWHWN
jgi:hypothetical protein